MALTPPVVVILVASLTSDPTSEATPGLMAPLKLIFADETSMGIMLAINERKPEKSPFMTDDHFKSVSVERTSFIAGYPYGEYRLVMIVYLDDFCASILA